MLKELITYSEHKFKIGDKVRLMKSFELEMLGHKVYIDENGDVCVSRGGLVVAFSDEKCMINKIGVVIDYTTSDCVLIKYENEAKCYEFDVRFLAYEKQQQDIYVMEVIRWNLQ